MKRITEEERVVEFFNTAPPEAVRIVFNIVAGIVKRRAPKVERKPRAKKEKDGSLAIQFGGQVKE